MKSLFVFYLTLALTLTGCSPDLNKFEKDLFSHIDETEKIVIAYDSSVLVALEKDSFRSIIDLSNKAIIATNKKMEDVKLMETPPKAVALKLASIVYIESLMQLIKAEEVYTFYSDSLTIEEIDKMDATNIGIKKEIDLKYQLLMDEKSKLKPN